MGFTTEVMSTRTWIWLSAQEVAAQLRQAMTSGKKVIGAGPANPVAIVDATANFEKAARDIVRGASFDNNLMCTSEKCMVVEEKASGSFYI